MAVYKVLSTMIEHEQDVEYLVQAVVAARCWLTLLPPVPVDGNAGVFQVRQEQSGLQHRPFQQRPAANNTMQCSD